MSLQMSKDLVKNAKYVCKVKSNYLENRKFSLEYLWHIFEVNEDIAMVSNKMKMLDTVSHGVQQN